MNLVILFSLLLQTQSPDVQQHIKVTYRQIQIRVQDGSLNPKKGLQKDDFLVTINGKKLLPESFIEVDKFPGQPFAEVNANTANPNTDTPPAQTANLAPPETDMIGQEQKAVAIFLDPGLSTINGYQIMKQTAHTLINSFPPDTKIAVYQMHYSLQNLIMFSTDRELVGKSIDDARFLSDLWNNLEALQRGINNGVRQINDTPNIRKKEFEHPEKVVADRGNRNIAALAHLGELLKFKKQAKDAYTNKVAKALDHIGTGLSHFPGERSIYMLTAGGYMDDSNRSLIRSVTAKLNWENTPIHTIHFRDRDNKVLNLIDTGRQSEQEIRDAHQALLLGGFVQNPSSVNALAEEESFLKSSPRTFAEETGGTFVSAFNPLQVAEQLNRTLRAAGHYYLISYPSESSLDKLEVKLAREDDKFHLVFGNTRGSYSAPLGKNAKDRNLDFATNLVYGVVHDDTPIEWDFNYFITPEGNHVFPVLGKIKAAFPKGGYKLAMVALSEAGEILDERSTEIRKPSDTGELQFYDLLVCETRPAKIRALLQENETGNSNLGEMLLPDKAEGANLSSVVLVPSKPNETFAIHSLSKEQVKLGKKKVARDTFDPLLLSPQKRIPLAMGPFAKGEPIGLYFHAENLDGKIDNYDLESYLETGEKKQFASIQINKVEDLSTNQASLMAVLDTSQLNPSAYTLGLRLKDKRTGATCAYSQQQIQIQ